MPPLVLGGAKEASPAIERVAEQLGSPGHDRVRQGVGVLEPRRCLGCQLVADQVDDPDDPFTRLPPDFVGIHWPRNVLVYRLARRREVKDVPDRWVEGHSRGGKPDGVEMALHEAAVGKVEQWRAHLAMDHALGITEVVLVVGALRRTVGEGKRGLSAPSGPATALGIVRRGRRNVPEVYGVERRDVDTEFHRRRTEEDRQEPAAFAEVPQGRIVREFLALPVAKPEPLFPDFAPFALYLGRVFAGFEPEQGVVIGAEQSGQGRVEVHEVPERDRGGPVRAHRLRGMKADTGILEPPGPGVTDRGRFTDDEATPDGDVEEGDDDLVEAGKLEVPDGLRIWPEGVLPGLLGSPQEPPECTPAAPAQDEFLVTEPGLPAPGCCHHEERRPGQALVVGNPPWIPQVAEGPGPDLLEFGRLQDVGPHRHALAEVVEDDGVDRPAVRGSCRLEDRVGGREGVVITAKVVKPGVFDMQEPKLLEIGVGVAPTATLVEPDPVREDLAQGLGGILKGGSDKRGFQQPLAPDILAVVRIPEPDGLLHPQADLGAAKAVGTGVPEGSQEPGPQDADEQEVIEVPGLQCRVLPVVREPQHLPGVFGNGRPGAVHPPQGASDKDGGGRTPAFAREGRQSVPVSDAAGMRVLAPEADPEPPGKEPGLGPGPHAPIG